MARHFGRTCLLVPLVALGACATSGPRAVAEDDGPRVVLVTMDGVRWQEIFRGADPTLLAAAAAAEPSTIRAFAQASSRAARAALLPFFWSTIGVRGALFGNLDRGSVVRTANPRRVSYPGYHELLTGFARPAIVDNRPQPNPDVTVLEWLARRPGFTGRVAAYASWDLFPLILNVERSGLPVSRWREAGLPAVVEQLRRETVPPWRDGVFDTFVFRAALQFLQTRAPRVLFIALGDTDEWAHAGRYDRYLEALHRSDGWLSELWQVIESSPAYRGRTSLVITTDHGRGRDAETWNEHNDRTPGSEEVWVALLGPKVAGGERSQQDPMTLSQVAATVAALASEDYRASMTAAAPALPLAGAP